MTAVNRCGCGEELPGGGEVGKGIILAPGCAHEELRGLRGEGGQDGAGEDGDDGAQFTGRASVGFVVNIVDDEQTGGMLTDDGAGSVAETQEGGVFAFFLGAEGAPGFIFQIRVADFVAARAPANLGIRDDVGKSDMPGGVIGNQVGDLGGSVGGSRIAGLDDEVAFMRLVTDAEGGEGDGERSGLGGAAEGEDDQPLFTPTGRVEGDDPFAQGVARKGASID